MNNIKWLTFMVLMMLLSRPLPSLTADEIPQHKDAYYAQNTEAHVFESEAGQTMPYRLYVPTDYDPQKKYPIILSFHGAGQREKDNVKHLRPWVAGWLDEQVQNEHPCIILMPQCPKGQQWVNTPFSQGSYSLDDVPISRPMLLATAILDQVMAEKSIDPDRIYVMGASMGGYAAWDFAMRNPQRVAAVVAICGGGDPSKAPRLVDIPIWAFHGALDKIVPPEASKAMVDAIHDAGGQKVKLTIYENVEHGSYAIAWKSPELVKWVFSQVKKSSQATAEHK